VKKYLITGIAGFVGTYLKDEILKNDSNFEIHGIHRSGEVGRSKQYVSHELDIRDTVTVSSLIESIKPDVVYHLAAQPFVPKAILDPWGTLDINVKGSLNLLEALKKLERPVRMVYISSADVYGRQSPENMPLSENTAPNPVNPYSASKLSAEVYCRQYAAYSENLDVMIARPFNHIGIGQRKEFVVPNFCSQIVDALLDKDRKIHVGDLSSTRDFLDVRDVVRAYRVIAESGTSGEVYNICSGLEISIQFVLEKLIEISGAEISIQIDSNRIRPVETARLFGQNGKLQELGWEPKFPLEKSLNEIYSWIKSL
jgi:GDP-4-dehydro-6-deoxy-D-mannose reductase